MKNGGDQPLQEQINQLINICRKNPYIKAILGKHVFSKNVQWYLGAGCICQSVWNFLSDKEITSDINDYDLVYYDASDISKDSETKEQERIRTTFSYLPIEIEVVNEARMHLWYKTDFGKKINQFKSCEDAINDWPTTATAIGINWVKRSVWDDRQA